MTLRPIIALPLVITLMPLPFLVSISDTAMARKVITARQCLANAKSCGNGCAQAWPTVGVGYQSCLKDCSDTYHACLQDAQRNVTANPWTPPSGGGRHIPNPGLLESNGNSSNNNPSAAGAPMPSTPSRGGGRLY
jgi:hypothetical protein